MSLEMNKCEFTALQIGQTFLQGISLYIESDLKFVVESLKELKNTTPRVIVYSRSLDMCANLYAHFHFELGDMSYYPPRSNKISDNRLFGMFHASTPEHRDVIF